MAAVPVHEAVEWREPAPGGGSHAQVFRLADGRFTVVKFPENQQGELVLANEFLCCQLAETLELPVNRAVLVSIDERLLRLPREQGKMPAQFSAGVRCGMIRFENAEGASPENIAGLCDNHDELHHVAIFEQLVDRRDGRQLLMYANSVGKKGKRFAAYDYGFAFGGQPQWTSESLSSLPAPILPVNDPFTGQPYQAGDAMKAVIDRMHGRAPCLPQCRGGVFRRRCGLRDAEENLRQSRRR